jgi:hypothetical protein
MSIGSNPVPLALVKDPAFQFQSKVSGLSVTRTARNVPRVSKKPTLLVVST